MNKTLEYIDVLEQILERQNKENSGNQRECRGLLKTVRMGFGNHLIADDVKHGAACRRKKKGERTREGRDERVAGQDADDADERYCKRYENDPYRSYGNREEGRDDDESLRDVLNGNRACDGEDVADIASSETYSDGQSFGNLMKRERRDEEEGFRD